MCLWLRRRRKERDEAMAHPINPPDLGHVTGETVNESLPLLEDAKVRLSQLIVYVGNLVCLFE